MKNHVSLFSLFFLITIFTYSQSEEYDIKQKLPSLDSLIAIAVQNSANLKFFDSDTKYWREQEALEKSEWLDYFFFESNYGYGVFDNLNNQQLAGDPQASQTLFTTEQDKYSVGVSLKLPLSALFNRKKNIKSATALADKAAYQHAFRKDELVEIVIRRYHGLLRAYKLFSLSGNIIETYKIQSISAEKDLTNGVIDVLEYTRQQQMLNQSLMVHEEQRSELILSLSLLEKIVGIKLSI